MRNATSVTVRFRVKPGEGPLAPDMVIDRLLRYGFEQIMEHEPKTHAAIKDWQITEIIK